MHGLVTVYVSHAKSHIVLSRQTARGGRLAESMKHVFSNLFRTLAHYLSHRVIPDSHCLYLHNVHDSWDGVYD